MKPQLSYKEEEMSKFFDFPSTNSKITKEFCNKHIGTIPVYASSKDEKSVIGYIEDDLNGIKYYENCLSWNRNGSVGYVFIRDHKFTTNEDHRAMVIKKEFRNLIDKQYLKYEIEKNLHLNGFSFLDKCGVDKIKSVLIKIPVKNDGTFDLDMQKELGAKYGVINELKKEIFSKYENIEKLKIDLDIDCDTAIISLSDNNVFFVERGERIRKQDIIKSKGDIPVYSGSKFKEEAIGYVSDDIKKIVPKAKKFKGKFLTINANGSVGKVFLRDGTFYLHDDVNILTILDENIIYEYLVYELQNKIEKLGYNKWTKKLYRTELLQEVYVEIPVTENGQFDVEKQKEIAHKYNKLEYIKRELKNDFDGVYSLQVDITEC